MRNAHQAIRQALDDEFQRGYRLASGIMGAYLVAFTPFRPFAHAGSPYVRLLTWESALMGLACLVLAWQAPFIRKRSDRVEVLGLAFLGLLTLHCEILLGLLQQADLSVNFMLTLVVAGMSFQRSGIYLATVGLITASWLAQCLVLWPEANILGWAPGIAIALVASGILHLSFTRIINAFMKLRVKDQIRLRHRVRLIRELRGALDDVRALQSLVPICSQCKKVRDDAGYWQRLEHYFENRHASELTHSLCPDCAAELRDEFDRATDPGRLPRMDGAGAGDGPAPLAAGSGVPGRGVHVP